MLKKLFSLTRSFLASLDHLMMLLCLSASAISLCCMFSYYNTGQKTFKLVAVQGAAIAIGLVLALVISMFDYVFLVKLWKLFAPVALGLVVLTFFIGVCPNPLADDKAWLDLGFTTFQPSELLKIAFILTFAYHLSHVGEQIRKLTPFLLLCLHGAVPTLLVVLQGDYGTAIVFVVIFALMMTVAGLPARLIALGGVGVAVVAPIAWTYLLPYYIKERFLVAQHPELYINGRGYQQYRGRIGLGSGGLYGRGVLTDRIYQVTEAHNDFIFSYIGQIFGFVGTVATLLILTLLCIKMLTTAWTSKDALGRYICIGVFAMFCFQAVVNIGMVLCVFPVVGITLPLFSAGGTSVMISYMAIGLVLSVYRKNKREYMFD